MLVLGSVTVSGTHSFHNAKRMRGWLQSSCKASLVMAMAMATTMMTFSGCVRVAASPPSSLLCSHWRGFRPACLRPPSSSGGSRIGSRGGAGRNQEIRNHQVVVAGFLPVDPWAPNTDQQSVASSLFAASLFPYLGFLYHLTKSKTAPKLTLFGFYFLLAFVGATIPAGIYAKVHYGTSLSNVDWLHGGAESLLTLTNLFIVFGLRNALQRPTKSEEVEAAAQEEEEGVPLSK